MQALQLIMNPGLPDEQVFPLREGSTLIGRDTDNPVHILHKSLSRKHARLDIANGKVTLVDLHSKNGTSVRGTRLTEGGSRELRPGDTFTCGAVDFKLVIEDSEHKVNPTRTHSARAITEISMRELLGQELSQSSALKLSAVPPAERARDKLQILLKVSELMSSPGTIDTLMERALDLVFQILDVDRAVILLVEQRTGALLPRVTRTADGSKSPGSNIYSKHIVNYVQHHGVAALFADARLDPRLETADSVMQQSIYAAMCAPLKARTELLGVLYVDNLHTPERFSPEDLEFLSSFANLVAIALENAMLNQRIEQEAVLRNNYQRFFPPSALKRLEQSSSGMVLGARETEVTTLFSDISGFTSMSSRMRPTEVVDMLNEYFPIMADIVFEQEGTLEKYIGDALMAIWGAPFGHPDDADRALWAAVRMQQELMALNERRRARGQEGIQIHIGLNTGMVAAGNIGSKRFLQYATIGDTTNVAARVCSASKEGEILITQSTYERLVDQSRWKLELLPPVQVKGKEAPLTLYRLDWSVAKPPAY